jgi:NADH-quinone oxidoreductase subunit H
VATVRALNTEYNFDTREIALYGGIAAAALIAVTFVWDLIAARRDEESAVEHEPEEFDAMAGGHPVPPMPGQSKPALTGVGATTTAAGPDHTATEDDR